MRYGIKTYIDQFVLLLKLYGPLKTFKLCKKLLKTILSDVPSNITIEPAGFCNFRCPMCIQGRSITQIQREQKLLKWEHYKKVIDDIKDFTIQISLFYAGEPTLNPKLPEMIKYAYDNDILTYINTNGSLFSSKTYRQKILNSGLHRIHFSVDGVNAETYSKYRQGGDFGKIIEGIRCLVEERGDNKTPIIVMQTLATNTTIPQMDSYADLAKSLGVDRAFATSYHIDQYEKTPTNCELQDVPINNKYSRYEAVKNNLAIKKKNNVTCCPLQKSVYILTNGTVIQCCYDENGEYTFGNAFCDNLIDIWQNNDYVKWRKELLKPMKLSLCQTCTITSAPWITLYEKY